MRIMRILPANGKPRNQHPRSQACTLPFHPIGPLHQEGQYPLHLPSGRTCLPPLSVHPTSKQPNLCLQTSINVLAFYACWKKCTVIMTIGPSWLIMESYSPWPIYTYLDLFKLFNHHEQYLISVEIWFTPWIARPALNTNELSIMISGTQIYFTHFLV